jgi:hypothetical protein
MRLDVPDGGTIRVAFLNARETLARVGAVHMARLLEDRGGKPAHGNQRSAWDAGSRFDFENPEYR